MGRRPHPPLRIPKSNPFAPFPLLFTLCTMLYALCSISFFSAFPIQQPRSSVFCHLPSVICHLPSVFRHLSSALRLLSSAVRHLPSALRHLSSVLRHLSTASPRYSQRYPIQPLRPPVPDKWSGIMRRFDCRPDPEYRI